MNRFDQLSLERRAGGILNHHLRNERERAIFMLACAYGGCVSHGTDDDYEALKQTLEKYASEISRDPE